MRHYRLGDDDKIRIGIIGPEVAQYVPDAVELIQNRPGDRRGGSRNADSNDRGFPTVNEHTLFMYGIGATKELAKQVGQISQFMIEQRERIMQLYYTAQDLEKIFNQTRDNSAELRMKETLQRAEIARFVHKQIDCLCSYKVFLSSIISFPSQDGDEYNSST